MLDKRVLVGIGKLLGVEFDNRRFLDRGDAVFLCKKAQADTMGDIISKLDGKVDETIISELKSDLEKHWETDISALGM